jgi:hypothetical protein
VYQHLADAPAGRSVKDLLSDFNMPEPDLRETLRKLDDAGLAQRIKGTWRAVPLEAAVRVPAAEPAPEEGVAVARG